VTKDRRARRTLTALGVVSAMTLLAACSDDDGGGGGGSGGGSGADASGVAEASAAAAELVDQELSLEPLSATPPTGKKVAVITCTLPACRPGTFAAPGEALGWTVEEFNFDVAGGPQAFVAANEAALASNPDYLAVSGAVYPEEVNAAQLAKAEAQGVEVIRMSAGSKGEVALSNVFANPVFVDISEADAHQVLSMAGGPVEVTVPYDPSSPSFQVTADAFEEELLRLSPSSKVNRLEVSLAQPPTEQTTTQINFLRTHPETDYLAYVGGSAFYQGMNAALESSGLADQVKVFLGWCTSEAEIEAVGQGDAEACVVAGADFSWIVIDTLARLSVGDPVEDEPGASWLGVVTKDDATPDALNPPNYQDSYKQAWQVD
jgi:hypothetical protein